MSQLLRSYTTGVWLILVLLTGFSWWLSTSGTVPRGSGPSLATASMFLVGFVKVRMVGMHFMELKRAPLPLRLLFEFWALGTSVAIVGLYWLAAA
jgi:hypothetical protein